MHCRAACRTILVTLAIPLSLCVTSCAKPVAHEPTSVAAPDISVATAHISVPSGVFVSASDLSKEVVDGLYPSRGGGDRRCCWLAPEAHVRFVKNKGTSRVVLSVYVEPGIPAYQAKPTYVTVSIAGREVLRRDRLSAGENRLVVSLPASMQNGAGPYELTIRSRGFVPDHEFHNGDTRTLGIILESIESSPK